MIHIAGFILFVSILLVFFLARKALKKSLQVQVAKIDNLEQTIDDELQKEKSKHESK